MVVSRCAILQTWRPLNVSATVAIPAIAARSSTISVGIIATIIVTLAPCTGTITILAPCTGTITILAPCTGTITILAPCTGTITILAPCTGTITIDDYSRITIDDYSRITIDDYSRITIDDYSRSRCSSAHHLLAAPHEQHGDFEHGTPRPSPHSSDSVQHHYESL
jgi:hypothetical protein